MVEPAGVYDNHADRNVAYTKFLEEVSRLVWDEMQQFVDIH